MLSQTISDDDRRIVSDYLPLAPQSRFHSLACKEKLFLAGVGSGKTICGVHECIALLRDNPKCNGLIVAPTFPMLRDIVLETWQQWIPVELYSLSRSDMIITYHGNRQPQKIFLRSATEPSRISGLTVAWAWLEEAGLLAKSAVWKIMQARVRDPRAGRRCLFSTSTPGFMWLVNYFREHGSVIRARTRDNTYLPDDFEPGLRAAYGEEYARAFLDGEILDFLGLVWPIAPRLHCSISPDLAKKQCVAFFGGTDFGHTAPAAHVVGGIDGDGRWYLVDEWYKRGQNRDVIATEAKKLNDKWSVRAWYTDHDPEGVSRMQDLHLNVVLADKDVISGIQHVRMLLAVRDDLRPRFYVVPGLKSWHREQRSYRFPEDKEGKEEPVGGDGDHAMDATRYMIYTHSLSWAQTAGVQTVNNSRYDKQPRSWEGY